MNIQNWESEIKNANQPSCHRKIFYKSMALLYAKICRKVDVLYRPIWSCEFEISLCVEIKSYFWFCLIEFNCKWMGCVVPIRCMLNVALESNLLWVRLFVAFLICTFGIYYYFLIIINVILRIIQSETNKHTADTI